MHAVVKSIAISRGSSESMQLVDVASLEAGVGIVGDRYATGNGTYSCLHEPGRQVTLVSASGAEEALLAAGVRNTKVSDLRRNIVLDGISADALNSTVGRMLLVGDVQLFVHRLCVPCMYNERINRAQGLMCGLWHAGGVNCEVIVGGTVRVGDTVTVGDSNPSRVNNGGKPAAFFKHPQKRTADEVRACIPQRKAADELAARDPVGAWRLQTAYEKVGISFFAGGMPKAAQPPTRINNRQIMALAALAISFIVALLWRYR